MPKSNDALKPYKIMDNSLNWAGLSWKDCVKSLKSIEI